MRKLRVITYNGQDLLVVADGQGRLVEDRKTIKFYADSLNKTLEKLTNEAILNINKKLLKSYLYWEIEKNEESA